MLLSDILLDFSPLEYSAGNVPGYVGFCQVWLFGIAVVAKQSISPVQSWHVWSEREKKLKSSLK